MQMPLSCSCLGASGRSSKSYEGQERLDEALQRHICTACLRHAHVEEWRARRAATVQHHVRALAGELADVILHHVCTAYCSNAVLGPEEGAALLRQLATRRDDYTGGDGW